MNYYTVNIYCREVWHIQANNEEQAREKAKMGVGTLKSTIDTGKIVVKEQLRSEL